MMILKIRLVLYVLCKMKKISWNQITRQHISEGSGVYAWYYTNKISLFDIKSLIQVLGITDSSVDRSKKIEDFIREFVLLPYEETPFNVTISGKLKPRYTGELFHEQTVTDLLVSKISCNPNLLFDIRKMLATIDYSFMSPLYIGMASNLVVRILKHKFLIEQYGNTGIPAEIDCDNVEDKRDHDYASRVVKRKLTETNLYVVLKEIDKEYSLHNITENILNRINYPILGRN